MKNLIARVEVLSNGIVSMGMGCFDNEENLDVATTSTLLDLIEQSIPDDRALEALVAQAEAGRYVSPNPAMPDWGVNDINIWLVAPMAQPGHVCVTNENTEYSSDDDHGNPQQFTYKQFHAALKHWREFQALITQQGKDKLVGQRYAAKFPDPD
jgi:hypothetical protein